MERKSSAPRGWEKFHEWICASDTRVLYEGINTLKISVDDSPAGFSLILSKLTTVERLMGCVFGRYPDFEQVRSRSQADVSRLEKDTVYTAEFVSDIVRETGWVSGGEVIPASD